ncbi:hypothetical protein LUZ60_001955 [Juncus effusus]|nr:hypothetical protein LUZ60_001955 [Juncus effusus]
MITVGHGLRRGGLFHARLRIQLAAAVHPYSSRAASDGPHLPVLIVGAGPVGLVLSMLLTKFGVKCAVLEKSLSFSRHPQAHFINNRTMEIFRKLDGLAEDIEKLQPPVDLWRKFIYCTSLSGPILGSIDHMQPQDFEKIISPVTVAHFSQYKLVKLLLNKLQNLGIHIHDPTEYFNNQDPSNKILMGHECTSIARTDKGIIKVKARVNTGTEFEEREFSCDFLIGSDGSGSSVRKLVGVEMRGERGMQELISVHFCSKDLGKYLLEERPGMLFFVFNQEAIGVLVAHDLNQGEFVLQIPYYPPQQNFQDYTPQMCERIISNLVGWGPPDMQVLDIKPWVMNAEVAERYLALDNCVILAGDSAHRFPPAGGFGMNTGIQDAHNLAWKLYYLLNNIASPTILKTYESERRPIAISNTNLSVENFKAAMSIPSALGLDPQLANSVHQVINSGFGSIIPKSFQKTVLEGIFSIGRAQLSDLILNEKNPIGVMRLAKLKQIFDEGKSLQLQFPSHDLGFCYEEGALISENGNPKNQEESGTKTGTVSRDFVPTAKPGSRLPHMLVRRLNSTSNQDTFSTLDLISSSKPEFLLIISPNKQSYKLARSTLTKSQSLNLPLKICIIWPHRDPCEDRSTSSSSTELEPFKNFIDVEEVRKDGQSWWDTCRLTSGGVILVRPDEHIAWSAESDRVMDLDLDSEVERVWKVILGFS